MSLFGRFAPPQADASQNNKIDPKIVWLTRLMDDALNIPGTKFGVGLDGLVGLIPIVGDAVSLIVGLMMVREARRLGLPHKDQAKMVVNYAIDFLVGLTPVIGDLLDFAWKANRMNLDLIQKFLREKAMAAGTTDAGTRPFDARGPILEGKYTVKG
jgi:hypothetical protein